MLVSILVVFALALAAFALLFRLLVKRGSVAYDPVEWLEQFSPRSYRPMERLFDSGDYEFLASQPGYTPSIARRLRRERIGIFQSYLGSMIRDFHRLLKIARVVTAFATEDQTAFASALWRLRLRFYMSIVHIEARVALNVLGVGQVDAHGLVNALERLQTYTLQLTPALEL